MPTNPESVIRKLPPDIDEHVLNRPQLILVTAQVYELAPIDDEFLDAQFLGAVGFADAAAADNKIVGAVFLQQRREVVVLDIAHGFNPRLLSQGMQSLLE